jgi:hypothetical protein
VRRALGLIEIKTIAFNGKQAGCAVASAVVGPLLPHQTNPCRTALDHIEFACCGTTYVDNAAPAIRPAIYYPHDYSFAIAKVRDQHLRAERQSAVRCSQSGWPGYLATRGATTAIERSHATFGVNRTNR